MAEGTQEASDRREIAQVEEFADVGSRLAAWVLDLMLATVAGWILLFIVMRLIIAGGVWAPAGGNVRHAWAVAGLGGKLAIFIGLWLLTGPLYAILFHSSPWQATVGKRMMGIHVTGSERQRIGIGRSIVRNAACFILGPIGLNLVSVIMVAVMQNRKGLHDLIAGTQVLTGRIEGSIEPWRIVVAAGFPVAWLAFSFVATL